MTDVPETLFELEIWNPLLFLIKERGLGCPPPPPRPTGAVHMPSRGSPPHGGPVLNSHVTWVPPASLSSLGLTHLQKAREVCQHQPGVQEGRLGSWCRDQGGFWEKLQLNWKGLGTSGRGALGSQGTRGLVPALPSTHPGTLSVPGLVFLCRKQGVGPEPWISICTVWGHRHTCRGPRRAGPSGAALCSVLHAGYHG